MAINGILQILRRSDFSKLIGTAESIFLDCKSQPYGLHQQRQQHELAKDVSAFANSEGGIIIIGIKTKKFNATKTEVVEKITTVPRHLIDAGKITSIIESWIFPSLNGLSVEWHKDPTTAERGLCSIVIPQQPKSQKPFLVIRGIDENDKIIGNVVGLFERKNDVIVPREARSIHTLLSLAENLPEIVARLDNIECLLETDFHRGAAKDKHKLTDEEINMRIESCANAADLRYSPYIALAAIPCQETHLPGLFVGREDPVVQVFEDPVRFRDNGWDMNLRHDSIAIAGKLRRISEPRSRSQELWHDGVLVFVGSASEDYYSWGNLAAGDEILQINPIALIESFSLFVQLSKNILHHSTPRVTAIAFRICIRNLERNRARARLRSVSNMTHSIVGFSKEAPAIQADLTIDPQNISKDEKEIYFSLFSKIFEWFGVDHKNIPLTKRSTDGNFFLDEDALKKLRG